MGFRGKQIATLTLVAAAVALTTSATDAVLLARSRLAQIRAEAVRLGQITYHHASVVIRRSRLADLHAALAHDPTLRESAEAVIGYSPVVVYVAIADRDGRAIFHSTRGLEGTQLAEGDSLAEFGALDAIASLVRLDDSDRTLVEALPFSVDGAQPYGTVRVAVSTLLLRAQLRGDVLASAALAALAVLVAYLLSLYLANQLLAPIEGLRRELARIDPGDTGPPLDLRSEADLPRLATFFASIGEKLRQEERSRDDRDAWLGEVLEGLEDAVLVVGRDGRLLSLNEPAARLLGGPRRALVGRDLAQVVTADHALAQIATEAQRADRSIVRRQSEIEIGGLPTPYLLSAHVLRAERGASGVMVAALDLGRLSRLASRLSYSQKLAALGELTSSVAHEIKNPLNAMVMHAALLRRKIDGAAAPDVARHLDVLDDEIRRMDRVVQGFLQFSRPEELHLAVLDMGRVLGACVERMRDRAEQCGVHLELATPDADLPVWGEEDLLRQAFANLLGNALEAMPDGGRLSVSAGRENGWTRVRIEDSGVGIPAGDLPNVFRLYFTTKKGGSGIGLAVVRRIVQLHGGDLSVDSSEGRGTVVTVSLPAESP